MRLESFIAKLSGFAGMLAAGVMLSVAAAAADYRVAVPHTVPGSGTGSLTPVLLFNLTDTGPLTALPQIPGSALDDPSYALFSASGELFVANRHGNAAGGTGSISRFTFDAGGNAIAGVAITGNALNSVHGLAFSPAGELFAADWNTGTISRFTFDALGNAVPNGTISTGGLVLGLAVSAGGELFASDYGASVNRWLIDPVNGAATPNGSFVISGAGNLHGLTFDANGNLFAADASSGNVFRVRFDAAGTATVDLAIPVGGAPIGVAFSPAGELFVSQHFAGQLVRFVFDAAGAPVANGSFNTGVNLGGVAVFGAGSGGSFTPVANAGPDQSVQVGALVTLDGTGSTDPNGDLLSFEWSILSAPAGSTATLSNPAISNPTFTVDKAGSYTVQLRVRDGTGLSSTDAVTISTINSRPTADAGPDQTVPVGTLVTLDGRGSFDADGNALTYQWSLTTPGGSGAVLSNPTAAQPTFVVDVSGTYTATLIVSDGALSSAADSVAVSTANSAPVANAGPNLSVNVGATAVVNGSASSDVDGDVLSYSWSLASRPAGSTATLATPTNVTSSFVVDVPGSYIAQLVVSDGALTSTATALIVGLDPQMVLAQTLQTVVGTINSLPPSAFQNPNTARALTNVLDAVRQHIEAGRYGPALNLVESTIQKTNGCAISGAPDANDSITDCAAQGQVYPDLVLLRDQLRQLAGP